MHVGSGLVCHLAPSAVRARGTILTGSCQTGHPHCGIRYFHLIESRVVIGDRCMQIGVLLHMAPAGTACNLSCCSVSYVHYSYASLRRGAVQTGVAPLHTVQFDLAYLVAHDLTC